MKNLLACYANCRYSTKCDDLRNEVISNTEQASSDINKYLSEHGRKPIVIQLMKRGLKFSDAKPPELLSGDKKKNLSPVKTPNQEPAGVTIKSNSQSLIKQQAVVEEPLKLSSKAIKKLRKRSAKPRTTRPGKAKEITLESTRVKVGKRQGASLLETSPLPLRKKRVARQKPHFRSAKKRTTGESKPVEKLPTVKMKNRKSAAMPRRSKSETNPTPVEKEQILNSPAQEHEVSTNNKAKMMKPARSKKRTSAAARGRSSERNGKVYIILEGKSANVVDEQGLMMYLFTNPTSGARYFEASEVEARVQITKK
jgi:hypothetical protein